MSGKGTNKQTKNKNNNQQTKLEYWLVSTQTEITAIKESFKTEYTSVYQHVNKHTFGHFFTKQCV